MSEPQKTDRVKYIDPNGLAHNALVTAVNGLNPGRLTLVYIDPNADERENVKQVFDVPHMDDNSRQEVQTVRYKDGATGLEAERQQGNPDLPTIHLNCWKEQWEQHTGPASDHPMFDHPFAAKPTDEDGRPIPVSRPGYEEQVADHQAANAPQQYAPSSEGEPEDKLTAAEEARVAAALALGQQQEAEAKAKAEANQPSGADLDTAAAEQKAKEETVGEKKEGLLHEIGEGIKHAGEAVGETATRIATSGLGAFKDGE